MFKEANPGRNQADPNGGDPALASDAAVGRTDAFDTYFKTDKTLFILTGNISAA